MNDNATSAPRHRMYNSGSAPRDVFRCPPLGSVQSLDLAQAVVRCDALPAELRDATWAVVRRGVKRFPREIVAELAVLMLRELGAEPREEAAGAADALSPARLLQQLVDRAVALGGAAQPLGLARHVVGALDERLALAGVGGSSSFEPLHVARTLAAYAVYSPPLLLWSRPASLDWLRADVGLVVRCLWNTEPRP